MTGCYYVEGRLTRGDFRGVKGKVGGKGLRREVGLGGE